MRGEYALGKFLKKRYVEEYKLLNATYILKEVSEVFILSTSEYVLMNKYICMLKSYFGRSVDGLETILSDSADQWMRLT